LEGRNNGRKAGRKEGRLEGRKEGRLEESFGNIPTCIPHESEKSCRTLQFFPKSYLPAKY
jgi:predicted transposase YdaD